MELAMNQIGQDLILKSQNWLKQDVFPLWIRLGVDPLNGGFIEALTMQGEPVDSPRRALVQARQIYSFVTGAQLSSCDSQQAHEIVAKAGQFFVNSYLTVHGSCLHAVTPQGEPAQLDEELYTQAFALFALAQIYSVTKDPQYQQHALRLMAYLEKNRRAPGGGYTEIKKQEVLFQSNPHMHLFEAVLAWIPLAPEEPVWKKIAQEVFELCESKFIDTQTGALCEHFSKGWQPLRTNENFVFEPGHHFEWSWLMAVYQELSGVESRSLRHSLYEIATTHGVLPETKLAVDEVWSDFRIKKKSSRFWPQTERIKAAVKLGIESPREQQPLFARSADEAMAALFKFFETPIKGLWQDTLLETGEFTQQDPKASSLYHTINAISEYVKIRPQLQDK